MKTILITGGAGFIGSNFVRYLYDRYPGYKIIVVDALTYAGSIQNLPEGAFESKRYEFWYGDVRNGELIDTLVAQSDVVVHMAAESHVTRSIYDNRLFFETDVLGTQTVANAVVKYRDRIERFIHISTSEVYGTAQSNLIDEEHALNPMSPYAAAKCGADRLIYSYWATYGTPVVIIRPFNTFGPYQHLEKAIPRFITSCVLGEPITIHGDGSSARDWLYIDDHCEALDKALHTNIKKIAGQIINLGTGQHRSVLEVANAIRGVMCKNLPVPAQCGAGASHYKPTPLVHDSEIQFVGEAPGQLFRHTCDNARAKELLDWTPRVSFDEALSRTIEWYRDNREWWQAQLWMRNIPILTAAGKKERH